MSEKAHHLLLHIRKWKISPLWVALFVARHNGGTTPMPTHLRPTQMAQHLDIAAQRISQLVRKGIIDPPGPRRL
jgi:hypothetical protein